MSAQAGLLLDTGVVADLRRPEPHPAVVGFLRQRRHPTHRQDDEQSQSGPEHAPRLGRDRREHNDWWVAKFESRAAGSSRRR